MNYDNPKWVHILNVSFLTISKNSGVLFCESVLHLLRFSVFIYTGTLTDTARKLCSLKRFGIISSFSYKIAPLNSVPSFPLQTNIVSLRTVTISFIKKCKEKTEKKIGKLISEVKTLVSISSKSNWLKNWFVSGQNEGL